MVTKEIYTLILFIDDHNHMMIELSQRHFIISNKNMPQPSKNILGYMIDVGIKSKKAFTCIVNKSGDA